MEKYSIILPKNAKDLFLAGKFVYIKQIYVYKFIIEIMYRYIMLVCLNE